MAEQLAQPTITSRIVDESQITQVTQGSTTLYQPLFTEKGSEKLQFVDGPSDTDYIKKYGAPNGVKYGQSCLNAINWLESGGTVVAQRLVPDDAKLSHIILDFQTKTVTQTQTDAPGTVDKVVVRARLRRVSLGAVNETTIDQYAQDLQGDTTADGYKHNIVGYFIVEGRGAYYNDLAIDLSLNTSLDDTYKFRVFELSILRKIKATNSFVTVSPAMRVAFDAAALDLSGESMFISDVLSRYASEGVYFHMYEDNWLTLTETLNANIDAAFHDPFYLSDRSLFAPTATDVVDIHGLNIPAFSSTTVQIAAIIGVTNVTVSNADLIYPGAQITIGANTYTVSAVNITTKVVTITSGLIAAIGAGDVVTVTPPSEYVLRNVVNAATTITVNGGSSTAGGEYTVDVSGGNASTIFGGGAVATQYIKVASIDQLALGPITFVDNGVAIPSTDNEIIAIYVDTGYIKLKTAFLNTTAVNLQVKQVLGAKTDDSLSVDFTTPFFYSRGSEGTLDVAAKNALLNKAYRGTIDERILDKKAFQVDVVLDANFADSVKVSANDFASILRKDCIFDCDLGFAATPEQAITKRQSLGFSTFYTSIFSQDVVVDDIYSGREIKVTPTYFLAKFTPSIDNSQGRFMPCAGPRRGVLYGFKNLSFAPNDAWQDRLYKNKINYIKQDPKRTMLFGNLTSQAVNSSLSDRSHVRELLLLQRQVESIFEDYQFELLDDNTITIMNSALSSFLGEKKRKGGYNKLEGTVYASAYDRKLKTARVRIEIVFTDILEKIAIDLVVK